MRLTRDHIALTFPAMAVLPADTDTAMFTKVLAWQFAGWTLNAEYAADIAKVIMHHVTDAPYTALPRKLQSYRASIDLFFFVAEEPRITLYLRSIAHATNLKRSPARFHQSLLASARMRNLTIPKEMLAAIKAGPTKVVRVRFPLAYIQQLLAKAKATGTDLSTIIRERVYNAEQEEIENDSLL